MRPMNVGVNIRIWTLVISVLLCWPLMATAQKTYRWVDQDGNVTYQDQPPPDSAQSVDEYAVQPDQAADTPKLPVVLYAVPACDACDLVRFLLEKNKVPFTEKNVGKDIEAQGLLKEKTGQLSVPTISVGEQYLMGYSSLTIKSELKKAGYSIAAPPAAETAEPATADQEAASEGAAGATTETAETKEGEEQVAIPAPTTPSQY